MLYLCDWATEDTDDMSDGGPEVQEWTEGCASTGEREAATRSCHSVATQTEVPAYIQEEKSCKGQSESHTEAIRSRIIEGMNDTQVKQLIAEHWPESAYTSTTLCRRGVLGAEVGDTRG